MMKLTKMLMAAAIILFAVSANAQFRKPVKFGVGLSAALPTGMPSLSGENFKYGGGIDFKLGIRIIPKLAATVSGGVNGFLTTKALSGGKADGLLAIPIKVGAKYFFFKKLYGAMELGITSGTLYHYDAVTDKLDQYKMGSSFTYAPGVGVQIASFDFGIRYEHITAGGFFAFRFGLGF
jgi:hypothetical protein